MWSGTGIVTASAERMAITIWKTRVACQILTLCSENRSFFHSKKATCTHKRTSIWFIVKTNRHYRNKKKADCLNLMWHYYYFPGVFLKAKQCQVCLWGRLKHIKKHMVVMRSILHLKFVCHSFRFIAHQTILANSLILCLLPGRQSSQMNLLSLLCQNYYTTASWHETIF